MSDETSGPAKPTPSRAPGRLAGKRVLITGTAGGQGHAAQRLFAAEGARIAGCDLQPGGAETSADELIRQGYDVTGTTVDLRDESAARAWVEDSAARLGGIDVLYNNAAGFGFAPFGEMTFALWRHVLSAELDLVFTVTNAAWKPLVDGGGSLINVGSISAIRGIAPLGQAAHAAAKGAVISLTRTLAAEGAAVGIRANAISPGFVDSPAAQEAAKEHGTEMRDYMVDLHLLRRPGSGTDTAAMALYLASDESAWVTGQNFVIDGGWSAGFR
ncbi:SDR family NAD(P)-dependent oxidoreductase [Streptomyces sp. NPDC096311]|uniref:SDR family NAD(P)-dependent oxidoreductase n=1 Tax=Streptomyces sp. NPDC096311 TaxID=3366083 RepID=UPI0037FC9512